MVIVGAYDKACFILVAEDRGGIMLEIEGVLGASQRYKSHIRKLKSIEVLFAFEVVVVEIKG